MKRDFVWQGLRKLFKKKNPQGPLKIGRGVHGLSRKKISPNALKVLYRLQKAGYSAYLVGGGVRDVLLDMKPKDFDIVTSAHPEQIKALFANCRIIGRRFRLVHVFFQGEIIEVSTFRANVTDDDQHIADEVDASELVIRSDNTYGTIEEDAWRRDFTVNSLYYNIADYSVVDYTGGLEDLKKKTIRMIGDPKQRYHEDPVRLLRAIRLAAKLQFTIHSDTEAPITELGPLLQHVPAARLLEEVIKMFLNGHGEASFKMLEKYDYLEFLFPLTNKALLEIQNINFQKFIENALQDTDKRFHEGMPLHPAFLFSILLWPTFQLIITNHKTTKNNFYLFHDAISEVIQEQTKQIAIPRRMASMVRSIWILQYHLIKRRSSRAVRLTKHRYFRAALDFLEIRGCSGEDVGKLAKWWRKFSKSNEKQRANMLKKLSKR